MKKFKFRLDRVLDTKRNREDAKQRELAEVKRDIMRSQEVQKEIGAKLDEATDSIRVQRSGSSTGLEIAHYMGFERALENEEAAQSNQITILENDSEVKRLELVRLNQEKQGIEKLREKRKADFDRRLEVTEQRLSDDLSLLKAGKDISQQTGEEEKSATGR